METVDKALVLIGAPIETLIGQVWYTMNRF